MTALAQPRELFGLDGPTLGTVQTARQSAAADVTGLGPRHPVRGQGRQASGAEGVLPSVEAPRAQVDAERARNDLSPNLEALYRSYGPLVRRRAQAVLGDAAAAEDAVQEVFVRALSHRGSFRAAASPRTWLYRVTMNYCLNAKRDGRRRRELVEEKVAPVTRTADHSLHAKVVVSHLLGRAPHELREVALRFYIAGMTQDETAEELGISRRTVGNRLRAFRGLARP